MNKSFGEIKYIENMDGTVSFVLPKDRMGKNIYFGDKVIAYSFEKGDIEFAIGSVTYFSWKGDQIIVGISIIEGEDWGWTCEAKQLIKYKEDSWKQVEKDARMNADIYCNTVLHLDQQQLNARDWEKYKKAHLNFRISVLEKEVRKQMRDFKDLIMENKDLDNSFWWEKA